jgi:hypothetical protein
MQLPGRLRATTLGDLLGAIHRAQATGTLELVEERGRAHRVHVVNGLVVAAELDGATASLAELLRRERITDDDTLRRSLLRALASGRLHGDVLISDFGVSPLAIHTALRRQLLARLSQLEQLSDARVHFRVAVRPPRGALVDGPLPPRDFLSGRRRARDRHASPPPPRAASAPASDARACAFRVLGVPPGADETEIKRAFRKRARELHPDLHPHATDDERRALETRFAEVAAAYRQLVA